ncbi:MAG TPA: hypothetical protein VKT73_05305 [Xanthobacteraceae bacterium]|nr:hypothetical protein [Xanthobacteraceae bacterium]
MRIFLNGTLTRHLPAAALLLTFAGPGPAAAQTSHSCEGAPPGSTDQTLALIPKCLAVFCLPNVDPKVKENLKHIDDKLGELQLAIAEVRTAYDKFVRACTALHGDISERPAMDVFRDSVMQLSLNKGKLSDIYDSLQHSPEEDIFANTSTAIAMQYKQPACMSDITQQMIDGLDAALILLEKAEIECDAFNPKRK